MSMASVLPVNRDDIAVGFGPHAPSSGKGSRVLHITPQAHSRKKKANNKNTSNKRHPFEGFLKTRKGNN
ncbi:unnamed protein product [Prunus armeniaca]|uniref:Uncharacterized protein n=1 Tax=Prunus armeniaca TaxID=36596 RepID=A0A6J5WE13_PRUAR|nr:unnamed protein product [Prunus armeniaca]CAB4298573.1 unnamed protein product [Prunus armeniaca]